MNKARAFSVLFFFGLLLITQFQNCGQTKRGQIAASAGADSANDSNIGSIDPIYKGQVLFDSPYNILPQTVKAEILGSCDESQEGAQLGWILLGEAGKKIESGRALCKSGRFQVAIDFVDEFPCNKEFLLRAQLGAMAKDESIIIRKCKL